MDRRIGLVAMLAVLAIVGGAAVVAVAGDDPAELGCADEWGAVGSVMPSDAGLYPTSAEAATAFAKEMTADGKPIPEDAELLELSTPDALTGAVPEQVETAVRVDGTTVAVLRVVEQDGRWAVEGFTSC